MSWGDAANHQDAPARTTTDVVGATSVGSVIERRTSSHCLPGPVTTGCAAAPTPGRTRMAVRSGPTDNRRQAFASTTATSSSVRT